MTEVKGAAAAMPRENLGKSASYRRRETIALTAEPTAKARLVGDGDVVFAHIGRGRSWMGGGGRELGS
ncbi:hypothetical protein SAMN02745121_08103 [Nannocystis exedens]|uniref:Uncharacterized protein n=1 Tax=Nannocystis exedens TaxID=54 RepID=A0A1I2HN07_9BACT|nr:hypothetical protein [Nannocystis exedens]PCC69384.1 hypothetical protein NAEX_02406 [Nannocystis exedens]SFF31504.1 hypothetical protein SAMN02745121_08103 [Nannocystis exedens]